MPKEPAFGSLGFSLNRSLALMLNLTLISFIIIFFN